MKAKLGFAIAAVLLLFSVMFFTTRVDGGHEAVLVKMYGQNKGVQDVSLVTGRVWYNPFTESVYEFPTYVQTVDYEPFVINSKDGSQFTVDPTMSLKITSGATPNIFVKYRKDINFILNGAIYNYIKDIYRIELNKYTADELISNREKFENSVEIRLQKLLEAEGFTLEQIQSGLKYPESMVRVINSKNAAIQEAFKVENELKIIEAQSNKKRVAAQANADAMLIQARAEAESNKLKQQSLTPMLIQQQWIEKWNGVTPGVTTGNGGMNLMLNK